MLSIVSFALHKILLLALSVICDVTIYFVSPFALLWVRTALEKILAAVRADCLTYFNFNAIL